MTDKEKQDPYLPRNAGDLITADDWNELQSQIKDDIDDRVEEGVNTIEHVKTSDDAATLDGKTFDELKRVLLEELKDQLSKRSDYQKIFKQLTLREESVIEHGLGTCPLVDVYQLDYFTVVCAADDDKHLSWVTFYLYHTSEKKIRFKPEGAAKSKTYEIERTEGQPYKVRFIDILKRFGIDIESGEYDSSSLGDLETEFWKAFFDEPNDEFDPIQYCHSPWFERCCREKQSVGDLRRNGDLDDLWFQARPRKTINYPTRSGSAVKEPSPAPTQIEVAHFDFDTLGVTLLEAPVTQTPPDELPDDIKQEYTEKIKGELKVMLLLKV